MIYKITISSAADKELAAFDTIIQRRIKDRILSLSADPLPPGVKKLKYGEGLFRIRCGAYRVIYTIEHSLGLVKITRVSHRRDAYR